MKVTWLRSLTRRYGAPAILFAGLLLYARHIVRRRRRRRTMAILITAIVLLFILLADTLDHTRTPSREPLATRYNVVNIGQLPGTKFAVPVGINDSNEIAGYCPTDDDRWLPFIIDRDGKMRKLPLPSADFDGVPCAINNRGQIAGDVFSQEGSFRGVIWDRGKLKEIGSLGGDFSLATGINDRDEIVGLAGKADGNAAPFIARDGKMTELTGFASNVLALPLDINESGVIAGLVLDENFNVQGFTLRDGKVTILATLGGDNSVATAINARGRVAGYSTMRKKSWAAVHAALWEGKSPTDLGTLGGSDSMATAISENGAVVGWSRDAEQQIRPFLRVDGKTTDLNRALANRGKWLLISATSINKSGAIVGIGAHSGAYHGYVLYPKSGTAGTNDAPDYSRSDTDLAIDGPTGLSRSGGIWYDDNRVFTSFTIDPMSAKPRVSACEIGIDDKPTLIVGFRIESVLTGTHDPSDIVDNSPATGK